MLVHSSHGCLVATVDARANRRTAGALRWLVLGAAGLIALVLALGHAASVGAAAPATYDTTICINYFTCYNTATGAPVSNTNSGYPTYTIPTVNNGAPTYTAPNVNSGYAANTVVSTYFDPRYCNGIVSVVTDQYGNLIDVCAATGQRIFPVFPDFGFAPAFVNPNVFFNGAFPNGCPAGNFSCLNAFPNGCPAGNFSCLGSFPFFGFPFSGSTGVFSGNVTTIAPSGNLIPVGPPLRVKEVAPTVTTNAVAQPAAAPAVPAPAAAPAPAAPAANYATALNSSSAPATAPAAATGGGVHALSAPSPTKPATADAGGSDDHRG